MKNAILEFFFPIDTETEELARSDKAWIWVVIATATFGIIVSFL